MIFDGGHFKSDLKTRTLRLVSACASRYNLNEANASAVVHA
jgi:hypothetical protein